MEERPEKEELEEILGKEIYHVWEQINSFILENYEMDILWKGMSKGGLHECKYRKSSKTLCCLYVREKSFGCMVIYGKKEREKFENQREMFAQEVLTIYDQAQTFYDGKWIMLEIKNMKLIEDIKKMIIIKRKPNKKR